MSSTQNEMTEMTEEVFDVVPPPKKAKVTKKVKPVTPTPVYTFETKIETEAIFPELIKEPTEDQEKEVSESAETLAEMIQKKEKLELQIKMFETKKKVINNITNCREKIIDYHMDRLESRNKRIEALQSQILEIKDEMIVIDAECKETTNATDDELTDIIIADEFIMNEVCMYALKPTEKVDKPKQLATKKQHTELEVEKKKGIRTAIDRKAYPNYLLHKMVFQASANHKTDKDRGKISMEVVFNAETKMFYNRTTNKEYKILQEANKVWCNERGYEKLGNSWEDFKALNLITGKTRSISTLHIDDWISDSISNADDYIDDNFEF